MPRPASARSPTRYGYATTPSHTLGSLVGVRLTEFHERVTLRFGATYGASVLSDHVLTGFDGRTGAQAIEDGADPRDVWRALCVDFDVPREQW
jgi:hypothetical protein